ncbi:DNA topoisomerase 2 [Carex littledalei]|uniref:DNA topoisomerase (ATP-hydrolyzing) n=1 Tax=Carex littledalei TaxID=544730 RepID=A0A833RNE5_9POAL|nr:DNA topoisomerase 2 [Carex littledalei]
MIHLRFALVNNVPIWHKVPEILALLPLDSLKGSIEKTSTKEAGLTYTVTGVIEEVDNTTLKITELPVRRWTQDYKEFLEGLMTGTDKIKEPFIKDYREHNDDVNVHFEVILSEENMNLALQEGVEKRFKLTTSISTTNMHLFDAKGVIKKYDTPEKNNMDNSDDAEGYVISVRRVSARLRASVEGSGTGRVTRSSSLKPLPPPQPQQAQPGTKPSKFHSTKRKSARPKPMGSDHDGRRRSGRLNPILENEAEEHPSSPVRIRTYFGPNPYLSQPQPQSEPQPQPQPQPQSDPQPDNETADNTFNGNTAQDADNFDPLFTYTAADTPQFSANSDSTADADNGTIAEKGAAVDLKDVFDRTHLKKSPAGKVYVSDKAKKTAELFQTLKVANGNEMDDEAIWNLAVKGEDKRGRVYGFGQRSRMSKANREVEAMEASPSEPTKSTATSAEMGKRFTAEEVEQLIAAQETRHRAEMDKNRKGFAQDIAAQEARHRAKMDENRKQNEYNRACLKALFAKTGAEPPNFSEFTSNVQASGVDEGDTGGGGGDIGGGGEPNNGK